MKTKRILSLLLCLMLALSLLPTTALAFAYTSKIKLPEPVEGEKPSTEATSSNNNSAGAVKAGLLVDEIVSVTWSGELDANGCFKAGVAYTVTVVDRISKGRWDVATFTSRTATINKHKATIVSLTEDDHEITISYTFPTLKGNAQIAQEAADAQAEKEAAQAAKEAEKAAKEHATQVANRWSQAEANAAQNRPLDNPVTIVVRDDPEVLNMNLGIMKGESGWKGFRSELYQQDRGSDLTRAIKAFRTLDGQLIPAEGFDTLRITKVVYDFYREIDFSLVQYGNVKEFWLGPNCDINGILNTIGRYYTGAAYGGDHGDFYTYDCILFIPESKYPNGPTYNVISGRASDKILVPGCRVMLYSGDVYEAVKKGASAARDWCTSHSYTAEIASPDRVYSTISCSIGNRYYYSCSKCGKCENNAKHTFDGNDLAHKLGYAGNSRNTTAHDYSVKSLSDEHFLGLNAAGDRVYLYACKYCGKDYRYHQINMTFEELKADTGETSRATYQLVIDRYKKWWAEGGSTYEKAIKTTVDKDAHNCFAVSSSTFVTAKHSGWAREDLNKASQEGLIDKSLLGDNYTGGINRLQFASVAVKMTEKMTGKSIPAAPAGTFTDTDNAYALKAYAAGITTGTGDGSTFDPNGILTRQQMATFLYRALQYVKANSDTEYSTYTSKLGEYSDAGQIESWAKDAMAFMNAFSLVNGSDGKLTPTASCTIEQSVIVALRSLDAGMLGWYQYAGDKRVSYYGLGSTSKETIVKGDRIWVTAIQRGTSSYEAAYSGVCVNPYGRSSLINLSGLEFMAIKDR